MKTPCNDGGPAFPTHIPQGPIMQDGSPDSPACVIKGMSLRDWFAGQALAGIAQAVVTASLHNSAQTPDDELTARWALGIADAIIAAREARQ